MLLLFNHKVVSDSSDPMDFSPSSFSVHRIAQARNTGMCCHFLSQGIFLTQGSNLHLLRCRWMLYHWATREVHSKR